MTNEARVQRIEELKNAAESDIDSLLRSFRVAEPDHDEDFARDLYAEAWRLGLAAQAVEDRRACVDYLVDRAKEADGYLQQHALTLLQSFRKDDFSVRAQATLKELVNRGVSAPLARVLGIAEVRDCVPALLAVAAGQFASATPALKTDKVWNASLALARMGDQKSLKRVLDRVESEKNIIFRSTALFQDLGYTKSPAAFDLLRRYLMSSARLPNPKDDELPGDRESGMAANVILQHVDNGPKVGDLPEDARIEAVRVWADSLTQWPIWR